MLWGGREVIMIEIKRTMNVMCLSHPQTKPSTPVPGKMIFHEAGPWCQKGWGLLLQRFQQMTCSLQMPAFVYSTEGLI